ncbi:hypothetical protein [Scopulibacillus cellulosilyticus]|uniref:Uncharacterized protein n=1 Tax=Scopulibacillus cellulosilyticus TaxID=2665665 RepID=A0ABW2PSC7_9BACL
MENNRWSYSSKDWLLKKNGKYSNPITKTIDRFLKAEPKRFPARYLHKLGGFNKGYSNPANYVKGHLLGLPANSTSAGIKTITKSVVRRFGPINVGATAIGESFSLIKKINKGTATYKDGIVFATNTAIKSTGTYVGAATGAAALSWAGPPGVIIGGMLGGAAGGFLADKAAKGVEHVVRHFHEIVAEVKDVAKNVKEKGNEIFKSSKKWVSSWFH